MNASRTIDENKKCSNHEFQLEQLKNYQGVKSLTQRRLCGPTTWKGTLTNALKDDTKSLKSLLGRPSVQQGKIGISWRICRSVLANCLEMLVLGMNW